MADSNGIPVPPEGASANSQPMQEANEAVKGASCVDEQAAGEATQRKAVCVEGAQPAQAAQPNQTSGNAAQATTKKHQKKKPSEQDGGVKGIVSGIIGAVVAIVVMMCLWSFTPLFDSMKNSTTSPSGNAAITVTDDTSVSAAEAVAAKDINSVVTIYVYSDTSTDWTNIFGNSSSSSSSSSPSALGSGVIIQVDGNQVYILTNYHVVEGISKATVKIGDNEYTASAVGYDSKTDLAVIKIEAEGLTAVEWGDSNNLTIGEWVAAIGSPYGYENTLTTGVVSALYRSDTISDSTTLSSTVYTDMIQTDAAINPGNSGGGLFDSEGKLIGINTYISSTSESSAGLGFAIPSSTAQEVAEQLIEGKTVEHAYLGIALSSSTSSNVTGAEIAAVYKDTAAAKAGLRTGDIITKIDDTTISSGSEVSEIVSSKNVGDQITITYSRDGTETTTTATLGSDSNASEEYADGGEPESSTNSDNGSGNSGDYSDLYDYLFGNGSSGNSGNSGGYDNLYNYLFGNGSSGNSDNSSGNSDSGSSDSDDNAGSFWSDK